MPIACASCGEENRPERKFCLRCGNRLERPCPSCGTTNEAGARFCGECGGQLTADAQGAPAVAVTPDAAAERRLVSVLFADLVGFTALAEDRDPEAVRELLTRYFDTATEVIGLHGGTVEKFIGDAVMAVWGTPVAHEDDAERAVRTGLELVDAVANLHPGLQARAGILTGEAAVTLNATNQGMVAGDLVNTAARLQGAAEAGTVLVGEATRRAAERSIAFESIGDHSLKGKTSPVPAWRALRVVAQRGGQGRSDGLEPPFVGREEELRQLKDVLHAVGRERRPRLVSITGTGGIGKSRLSWELLKYIDGISEPVYWHRGRSPSYGEGIAFWALGEMVRRRAQLTEDADEATTRERIASMLEEYVESASEIERIGPALLSLLGVDEAPPGGRDALFPAWRLLFERIAERGTTVLVFEDLQWADSGLLDFIDHLLDWTRGLPIMVLTLARPEIFDRRPDWGAGRRQLTALALEPLSDESIRELLTGLVPGLPADAMAAIVGRAEGVPLYAVEMMRGLLADGVVERRGETYVVVADVSRLRVPDSLRSLIASRLDALEPDDRALLQDAAVLGQVFSGELLAAITHADRDDLETRLRGLVRREVLDVESDPQSPERGQFRFVQSLIREVAYSTLARRDRRARHLAVARQFEAAGDDQLAGALASHYVAAHEASDEGPEADAIATQARLALVGAADRGAALGAHRQAIAHLEQALSLTTAADDRAPLLDRAATSAAAAALPDAATYAERAVEAYREIGDTTAAAHATARYGRVLLDASRVTDAVEVLERAAGEPADPSDPSVSAAIDAQLSRAYMRLGRASDSIAAADRALAIAEKLNLEPIVAEALINKAASLGQVGRRREGVALMRAAVELTERLPDRAMEIRARNNYAGNLSEDDPAASTRMVEETLALAEDIGDEGMAYWLIGNLAASYSVEGRNWDEHLVRIREAYSRATLPADRSRLRTLTGLIEIPRGENVEEIRRTIDEITGDSTEPERLFTRAMVFGTTALYTGDYAEAYREAMAAYELRLQDDTIPLNLAISAALRARDPAWILDLAPKIEAVPGTGRLSESLRLLGRGARAASEGRLAEAVAAFRAAHREFTDMEQHYQAAHIVVSELVMLPEQPEIRALAREVRPLLEELRARPELELVDAVLASEAGESAARVAEPSSQPTPRT